MIGLLITWYALKSIVKLRLDNSMVCKSLELFVLSFEIPITVWFERFWFKWFHDLVWFKFQVNGRCRILKTVKVTQFRNLKYHKKYGWMMDLQNEFKPITNRSQVMTLNTLLALKMRNDNKNDWIYKYMEKETI